MYIRIDTSQLRKIEKELTQMQRRIPMAIARGLNEAGDKTRTQVQRTLQKQTSLLRYSSVTGRVGTLRAYENGAPKSGVGPVGPGNLAYAIVVRGKPATKPNEFAVRVKTGPGGGVSMLMWGAWRQFKRSFQIKGYSGTEGLKARLGPERTKLRSFDGPNLASEATKGEVPGVFYACSAEYTAAMVGKHIARILR